MVLITPPLFLRVDMLKIFIIIGHANLNRNLRAEGHHKNGTHRHVKKKRKTLLIATKF